MSIQLKRKKKLLDGQCANFRGTLQAVGGEVCSVHTRQVQKQEVTGKGALQDQTATSASGLS